MTTRASALASPVPIHFADAIASAGMILVDPMQLNGWKPPAFQQEINYPIRLIDRSVPYNGATEARP